MACARAHKVSVPGERSSLLPFSNAIWPLIITTEMPCAYWCGCSNVAMSRTVAGSKITRSAFIPSRKHPAVGQPDTLSWKRRHLANRVFERQHLEVAHVSTQHAYEGAVAAGMRAGAPEQDHIAVGCNHRCRVFQNALDVVFADGEVDPAAVTALDQPQRRIRRILDRAGLATSRCDIIESLARQGRVPVAPGDHDVVSIAAAASFKNDPDRFPRIRRRVTGSRRRFRMSSRLPSCAQTGHERCRDVGR